MAKIRPFPVNIQLNNSYNNVIRFKNINDKKAYFNSFLNYDFFETLLNSEDYNFNIGDSINTSCTIDVSYMNINDALMKNYLIAFDNGKYYFYFINDAKAYNDSVVTYILELDVFTTYTINEDYNIENFFVDRMHMKRFVTTDLGGFSSFYFDINKQSKIQNPEDFENVFNVTYPVDSKEIEVENDELFYDEVTRADYESNNKGWINIFTTANSNEATGYQSDLSMFSVAYEVYSAPFMGIFVARGDEPGSYTIGAEDLYNLLKAGTTQQKVIGITFSKFPIRKRFYYNNKTYKIRLTDYYHLFDEEGNELVFEGDRLQKLYRIGYIGNDNFEKTGFEDINLFESKFFLYNEDPHTHESFTQIKKDIKYEPKLKKYPFTKLILKDEMSEGFEYNTFDLLELNDSNKDAKINKNDIKILEVTTPETSKFFATISVPNTYSNDFNKNKIGFIKNEVLGLPIVDDAYLEFVRNNKNALVTSLLIPTATGLTNAAATTLVGNPLGAAFSALGIATNAISYNMQMDNLKNKPDTITKLQNDFVFNFFANSNSKLYLQVEELKDFEKNKLFNFFYKNGYSLKENVENSENAFTRYIFNYLKTGENVSDKITTKNNVVLSNKIKNAISNALQNGVRFWESNSTHIFNYEYENFENEVVGRWL